MESGTTLVASTPTLLFTLTTPGRYTWRLIASVVNDDATQTVDGSVKRALGALPVGQAPWMELSNMAPAAADPRTLDIELPPNVTLNVYGQASGAGNASVRWSYDIQEVGRP